MNQIYDKINNHELLNYKDIARFMYIQTKGKVKIKFLKFEGTMAANIEENYLEVRIDYKAERLEYYRKNYSDKIETDVNGDKNTFLVDIYNLVLLFELYHELRHFKQVLLIDNSKTFKAKLLMDSYNFSRILPDMYFYNHDLYYDEYDATIRAFMLTLNLIENKFTNLSKDAIIEYNRFICTIIYHSYGNRYFIDDASEDYDEFTSPIAFSKFLIDSFSNNYESKKFSLCVKNMKRKLRTEYMRLINGFDISDRTNKLLYDLCMENYSTVNILDDIKKRTKRKYKTK